MEQLYLFLPLLFIVAFLYSSVGHGGASGYIALMTIFNFAPDEIKKIALILNMIVSAISFFQYYKAGFFKLKLFIPLACASIPFAFLGGKLNLPHHYYYFLLGTFLVFSIYKLLFPGKKVIENKNPSSIYLLLILGATIGFLSGLLGIGGGILLTPILLFFGWSSIKESAAISAAFIFVNSLSGLLAQNFLEIKSAYLFILLYVVVVFIAAIIGSYLGAKKWNVVLVKQILATVLSIALIKLILT